MPNHLYKVKVIKNALIPMSDGVTLGADIILPDAEGKFPGVLSFMPYHKDGRPRLPSDSNIYLAQRGYACVIADIRGTGNSSGYTTHGWAAQEAKDGYEAVEWIAEQSWCDGNIGMWGNSYGGMMSCLTAAQQPPHLKAIFALHHTIDMHSHWAYIGGSMNMLGCLGGWLVSQSCTNLAPPAYQDKDGRWSQVWKEHLDKSEPFIFPVFESPLREQVEAYEGSICYQYDKIKVPTYIVGGWRDPYTIGTNELFKNLNVPKKLFWGPWGHGGPEQGEPDPEVDYNPVITRWFDQWLKGEDTGIMDEPVVGMYTMVKNEFRSENEWPIKRTVMQELHLAPDWKLSTEPYEGGKESDSYVYNPAVGVSRGIVEGVMFGIGRSSDQRVDQAYSMNYATPPLEEDLEVTGSARMVLFAESSADEAAFVGKLCDVNPDGHATLVATGYLNTAFRNSMSYKSPVVPGEIYELDIELWPTSYLFKRGHKMVLSIASADFPRVFPTAKPAVNKLWHSAKHPSRLYLPTVPEQSPKLPEPAVSRSTLPIVIPGPGNEFDWKIVNHKRSQKTEVSQTTRTKTKVNESTIIEVTSEKSAEVSNVPPYDAQVRNRMSHVTESDSGRIEVKVSSRVTDKVAEFAATVSKNDIPIYKKHLIKTRE
jgi:putative CocE/NonD family hydrolase